MIKEKLIFWLFSGAFVCILVFGFFSQGAKKETTKELLQEMELAAKKSLVKKQLEKDSLDIGKMKASDAADGYKAVLKRSPFFRIAYEKKVKEIEAIPVEKKPKKPLFKYKGKVMMGSKVMVVIEEQGTGKSFFLQEGDMVGDFEVVRIGEKDVTLRQRDGKEIVLKPIKEEKKTDEGGTEDETGGLK